MKRSLWILAFLTAAGIVAAGIGRAQVPAPPPAPGDLGPGAQGATLKQPWDLPTRPTPAQPPAPSGGYEKLWNPTAAPVNPYGSVLPNPSTRIALPPTNTVEVNKEFEITGAAGPWVVFVTSYSGEKAPQMANKLVTELRNTYRLNAFVFNKGAVEKRKEYERVQLLKEKQRQELQADLLRNGTARDTEVMPIRIHTIRIEEQTAVLVAGGYKTRDEALEALKQFRKLQGWDPRKVDMEMIRVANETAEPSAGGTPKVRETVQAMRYISPFMHAFPARNPCVAPEAQSPEQHNAEMKFLRDYNEAEPLNLLKCRKAYTLCIKEFKTPMKVQDREKAPPKGVLDFGRFLVHEEVDYAAGNARTLAEGFRKAGLPEMYVLHTKFCSYVTVGSFDANEGPQMQALQKTLEAQFRACESLRPAELMIPPVPMLVPR